MTVEERLAALEARLQEVDDREAIREVLNAYNFAADTGHARDYAETFTENAVFDMGRARMDGRAAFEKAIADPEGTHKVEIEGKGSMHTVGPVTIRVDGLKAWAEGPTMVWVRDGGAFKVFTASYNHWDFEKTDGRWAMSHRTARQMSPGKALEAWTAWRTVR
jgi:hypothetical protein